MIKKVISLLITVLLVAVLCCTVCSGLTEEKYIHGEEGYYNIADELPDFKMRSQDAGDCWI